MSKHVGLIILDGWGIGDRSKSDAIYHAKTPYMDSLLNNYPNATLTTFGEKVGLPKGQMGNSEVGHLNIGAGRIVYQELTRINKSIRDGAFFQNETLVRAFEEAKQKGSRIHFMGLVSKGGVHSSQEHLYALCQMAKDHGIEHAFIHAFTDGRDCDPTSGLRFVKELEDTITDTPAKVVSVIGRYYAMDRDNRWERIKKAYDLMVLGIGERFDSVSAALQNSYDSEVTDEFIEPKIIGDTTESTIQEGDIVINFNFRTDRPREISIALTQKDFPEYEMHRLPLSYYTMTNYDKTFQNVRVIFEKENLTKTLGEVVADNNMTQVRIAETEKYPHVTFFFNGGRELPFNRENRLLINSPKVATYDLQPEMSALEVRDAIVNEIKEKQPNFICLNFANPDMVGHTGDYTAIQKAVETVDGCLRDVVETGKSLGYEFIVIADHGNADYAINDDGTPNTAHSLNPVPVVMVTEDASVQLKDGILADVAPTILQRLGIEQPEEMNGTPLIQ
ncbi:2,3-bisphosphoglycerate-independent phosphoglycerate mutase [Crocinitomicaceae bacterium]|nr:2,3-bisphosphoglycerate-independent phosphoglycerate mutase [Crocinitomicaceae bacterium]MDB3906784.1 2,3-bisphosphoglycerate-independent phosphoglycerate mutase [Crocinitomicaceae bacterium]